MEIKLHYLPDKPYYSCEVLAFHQHKTTGRIFNVANVPFSAKYGLFNCHDFFLADEAEANDDFNDGLVAWAYMDEVNEEVLRCVSERI